MKLIDLKVRDFVSEVASKSPAPGGGSVSNLAAALGGALACMVSGLTIGKKRYEALDEVEKNTFVKATAKIEELRCELMQLVDKDTDAFNEVMKAFGLPKVNDAEKKIRQTAIEMATIKAIEVPMKAAEISHAILREICVILGYGNPNTLSDIGVAALLLGAGIEGSILNVKINLPGLIDREAAKSYATKADALLEKGKALSGQIVEKVHSRMNV